jgi:hypothetical protein
MHFGELQRERTCEVGEIQQVNITVPREGNRQQGVLYVLHR